MNNIDNTPKDFTPEERLALVKERLKGTYSDLIGLEVTAAGPGYCNGVLPVKEEFLNPLKTIHGGFLFVIADTLGGIAASPLHDDEHATTISGTINFMRPIVDVSALYVKANVIKDGKRVVFVETEISGEDGTLFSKASFTYARISLKL
ncbi:MAG: PaaI family thioesterase [Lachnospiraceae bacterium]|nr:PaaI family thioesterase [Lachnospiraceae bacterium]